MRTRPASLRLRITLVALLVVGSALAVAAVALVRYHEAALVQQVDDQLRSDADFIIAQTVATRRVTRAGPPDRFAQLVDADGEIVIAGTTAEGLPPLASPPPPWDEGGGDGYRTRQVDGVGEVRLLARPLPELEMHLVVARSLEPVSRSTATLTRSLLALPLLLAGLGLVVWLVVRRALRPVEALRATVADISERDLSQRVEIPSTGDEVHRLATTMNSMLDRLESAVARERRLVADASHELRSPLAAARALVEADGARPGPRADGDGGGGDEAPDRYAVLAALERLQDVTDQLLVLSRQDEGGPPDVVAPVDLDDLALRHAAALERTTDLQVDVRSVSAGQVAGDEEALDRVVANLASNAARHARSTIAVSVAEDGGTVELAVADDGPGIPAADRVRVFERFTRLDDARSHDRSGAGLGLAIVAATIERHGGTVVVEDGPLGGARVVVRLPALEAPIIPVL